MVHPLLRLVATHPHLLADHAHAYGELVGDEISKTVASWKTRVIFMAAALGLIVFALGFLGVALMLWAAVPASDMNIPWLLVAVPAVPLVLGVAVWFYGQRSPGPVFEELRQQIEADMTMLRKASAR